MYIKSLEKEKHMLSCTDWWNLSKVSTNFFESSFCSQKESQGGLVLKSFKILGQQLHLPISQRPFFPYISYIKLLFLSFL